MLWALGFILSFAGLLIWLELGCMIPRSGGEKVYLEAAFRRPKLLATVFFAFQAIALGFTAAGCIVFASNMVVAANKKPTDWEERGIAIAVIVFVTLLHTFFPGAGVRTMNVVGLIKIFTLLFIIVTGWVILGGGVKSIPDPHASFRDAFKGSATSGNLYATALFKVLNSYAGYHHLTQTNAHY
jgi:amino acid transporter